MGVNRFFVFFTNYESLANRRMFLKFVIYIFVERSVFVIRKLTGVG